MIRITEEQFTEFKRFNDIEAFSEQEIIKAMNLSKIEKSSFDELNDDEKEVFKGVIDELSTFKKVEVLSPQPEGSMKRGSISTNYYIRPVQVEWVEEEIAKSIDGVDVIEKARSGIYKDTPENKKLGRVGQKFGNKKVASQEGEDGKKSEGKISKEDIKSASMNSLNAEYGGGTGIHITMKDGTKHSIKLSKEDFPKLEGENKLSIHDFAVEKINSGNYKKVEKVK